MIATEDGHIGAAPRPPLRDLPKRPVVHAQKADRPRGLARRGFDERLLGAQAREAKPVAAARLLNQCRVAQRLEDARPRAAHIVFDLEHETGCQLPERRPGASERGGVREKAEGG